MRIAVMGYENRSPSQQDMEDMKNLIAGALEEGAFGMSTGLAYAPGLFSDVEEIVYLARVVAGFGGLYTTHIRNERDENAWKRSVQEMIDIGAKTGVRVQISHTESHYPNWGKQGAVLKMFEEARQRGIDIACDVPPYVCGFTTITTILPDWALEGGITETVKRLKTPEIREKIRSFILLERKKHANPAQSLLADGFFEKIWIASTEKKREFVGKNLKEISEIVGKDPFDSTFDLIAEEEGKAPIVCEIHSEEDIRMLVAHPLSIIETDGLAWAPYGNLGETKPHPRSYGSFPMTIRKYVRGETRAEEPKEPGEKVLLLEEAIRKMTSFPAQRLGLEDRGILKKGMWADVVIFDLETISDRATYGNPHQYPIGFYRVLINGRSVVEEGEHTGAFPGKVLRKK